MRVLMIALGLTVFAVAALAALAWLADRQLDSDAAPYMTADIALLPAADVALVLGAAPIGPEGGPNRYLAYRLDAAAALWKAGKRIDARFQWNHAIAFGADAEVKATIEQKLKAGLPS